MKSRRITRRSVVGAGALSPIANAALARAIVRGGSSGSGGSLQMIISINLSGTTFTPSTPNSVVGTITVTMSPASPPFSGTVAFNTTSPYINSGGFQIIGSGPTWTLETAGGGGTSNATFSDVKIEAAQAGIPNSPQSITPTLSPPGTTLAFLQSAGAGSISTGGQGNTTLPYLPGGSPHGMWFTVGSSNLLVTAIGRWVLSGNNGQHSLTLYDAPTSALGASGVGRYLTPVSATVLLDTTAGGITANAYNYINLPTPVVLIAGRDYFLTSTELQSPGDQLHYPDGSYTTTADATLHGQSLFSAGGFGPWYYQNANGPFGPVNFIYQTTTALGRKPGSPFYQLIGRQLFFGGDLFGLPSLLYVGNAVTSSSMVTIDGYFITGSSTWYTMNGNNPAPILGTYVVQYIIDENSSSPIYSPYFTGPANYPSHFGGPPCFPWTFDTLSFTDYAGASHSLSDGTHSVGMHCVDSTSGLPVSDAYRLRCVPCSLVVQNSGANNGAQLIPVQSTFGNAGRPYPGSPDWIQYDGNTRRTNNAYPYPTVSATPVYDPSSPFHSSPRSVTWYQMHLMGMRYIEYETDPELATTLSGGVFCSQFHSSGSLTIVGAASAAFGFTKFNWDGERCDNRSDPLTTAISSPTNDGWIGVEYQGRIIHISFTGRVTTLFGLRLARDTKLPFDAGTATGYTDAQIQQALEIVGTASVGAWFGSWFGGWNDITFDPTDTSGPGGVSQTCYIASAVNHTIIKVTGLFSGSGMTPFGALFAGTPNVSGYSGDGGSAASALFNLPVSVDCDASGNLYIADYFNSAIRKVTKSTGIITTAFGNQVGKPSGAAFIAAQNDQTSNIYSPPTVSSNPSGGGYVNFPIGLRLTSTGDIVFLEDPTLGFRRIWLTGINAGQITLIGWSAAYADIASTSAGGGPPSGGFRTFAIDKTGSCGPIDDLFLVVPPESNGAHTCGRMSIDGSYNVTFTGDGSGFGFPGWQGSGGDNYSVGLAEGKVGFQGNLLPDAGTGVYSWLAVPAANKGMILFGGYRYIGLIAWRVQDPSDPDPAMPNTDAGGNGNPFDQGGNFYAQGSTIWRWGSAFCFPQGVKPPFNLLMGMQGLGHIGSSVAPSTEDICWMYNGGTAAYNTGTSVLIATMTASGGTTVVTLSGGNHAFVKQAGNYVMISGATAGGGNPNGMFKVTAFTDDQHFSLAMPGVTGPIGGTPVLNYGDLVMQAFIQRGATGVVPRPEITGRDWDALSYFIRRSTIQGSYPTPALPNPTFNADFNPPQITAMSAVRVNSHSITVTWTTDKPAIGMAVCGSVTEAGMSFKYSAWSPIEDGSAGSPPGYRTSHSATIPFAPNAQLLHYSVIAKDVAGNAAYGPDQTIAYP